MHRARLQSDVCVPMVCQGLLFIKETGACRTVCPPLLTFFVDRPQNDYIFNNLIVKKIHALRVGTSLSCAPLLSADRLQLNMFLRSKSNGSQQLNFIFCFLEINKSTCRLKEEVSGVEERKCKSLNANFSGEETNLPVCGPM